MLGSWFSVILREKELYDILMINILKENLKKGRKKVMAKWFIQTEVFMKEFGLQIRNAEWESLLTKVDKYLMEFTVMIDYFLKSLSPTGKILNLGNDQLYQKKFKNERLLVMKFLMN